MRLLLVEDEERLAKVVSRGLERSGFTVDQTGNAADTRAAMHTVSYDAIILDLGLPDENGMVLLGDLRGRRDATPVLILTARDSLEDRVAGLNAGADDYLLKPFAMTELVARVKALLRRPAGALGVCLEAGDVRFDTVHREVTIGGAALNLSRRELTLLEHLMRRGGRVIPRDVLEERIYGFDDDVGPNSLEVLVHRLRKKLLDHGSVTSIHTLRGVGYLLAEKTD